jgi:hypothetical protein
MAIAALIELDKLIETGGGHLALQKLASLKPETPSERRFEAHLRGKIHFFCAEYSQAISIYTSAIRDYGPHLRLMADIVGAYLLEGRFIEAKVWLEKLEAEMECCSKYIGTENLARVSIYLVKVNEEFCRFDKCFSILESLEHFGVENCYWKHLGYVSQLRLHALLGNLSYLPPLYREVSLLNHERPRFQIEKEHALCLADAKTFGVGQIRLRIERYLTDAQIPDDRILMLTELVEWCLSENYEIPLLFESFLNLAPKDSFESALQLLVLAHLNHTKGMDSKTVSSLLRLTDQCSPLGQMRLLSLIAHKAIDPSVREEIWNRWKLFSKGYPPSCQKYFDKRWSQLNLSTKYTVQVTTAETLNVDGREFAIPRNPLFLWLVQNGNSQTPLFTEDIIRIYWKSEYNESYFFRLKTAILRFNRKLQNAFKGENIFILTKQELKLNPRIEFLKGP